MNAEYTWFFHLQPVNASEMQPHLIISTMCSNKISQVVKKAVKNPLAFTRFTFMCIIL